MKIPQQIQYVKEGMIFSRILFARMIKKAFEKKERENKFIKITFQVSIIKGYSSTKLKKSRLILFYKGLHHQAALSTNILKRPQRKFERML